MTDYSVVLDENERAKMLADGYLPEVIDFHAKERFDKLQAEYNWKNVILGRYYEPTPYFDFVGDVFPDLEKLMVVTAEQGYQEMDIDELMEYQGQRDDVYVVPASFINGYNSGTACRDVYALVVDIDRIKPETLDAIIENGNLGNLTPMPTYIVNSGRGVHFYYVFEDPVPHYHANRKILKDMYRVLCGITQRNILAKTDWHAITQPFRLPGSLTRLGQTVTGWKCGEKWQAWRLADRLKVDHEELDLIRRPLLSQREYKELKAQREAAALDDPEDPGKPKKARKKRKVEWTSSLDGNTGFYLGCLERCYKETTEGSRYRSLCALTIVARKCGYPKEQLEKDLLQLLEHYNRIGKHMSHSEVKKALRMYNEKALQTRSTTLELWFGWEFMREDQKRLAKRKARGVYVKRTRAEICAVARKVQDAYFPDGEWRNKNGAPTKEQLIRAWRFEHPDGKPKDCIQDTGISKNTVYKWWNSKPEPAPELTRQPTFYRYTPTGIEPVYLEEDE